MTNIIAIILGLIAIYTGGNWLWLFYRFLTTNLLPSEYDKINDHAFKLGLCCILALGFLGLMLVLQ